MDLLPPEVAPPSLAPFAELLAGQVDELTAGLSEAMAGGISGLPSDESMRHLLVESVRANLEKVVEVYAGRVALADLAVPDNAIEYARRLAQREAPPNALARAYRWGQYLITLWAMQELDRIEADPGRRIQTLSELITVSHWYIDAISEQTLEAYQAEREEWLSHRSTVRAETLLRILDGEDVDAETAESALSYRLAQHHVAAILWIADGRRRGESVGLETVARRLAKIAGGASRSVLVWARDPGTAWVWFPVAADGSAPDSEDVRRAVAATDPQVHVAMGTPGWGVAGFRDSHGDAVLAEKIARIGGDAAPAFVAVGDAGVRSAALLASDLEGARRLVALALGGLAEATPAAERLRETVRVLIEERGSHAAAARRLHVHKNTVGYRLARAAEARGQGLDEGRLELELALAAAHWLGPSVLAPATS